MSELIVVEVHLPELKIGDEGSAVKKAQSLMKLSLDFVEVSGKFDGQFEDHVRFYQDVVGVEPMGVVEYNTWLNLLKH